MNDLLLIGVSLFLLRFSGSAGTAIVTRSNAYLFVDSRYWLQAREQVDNNWTIVELGRPGQVTDWVEWLLVGHHIFAF
jgi:Xaa-Pro aminopeptidase